MSATAREAAEETPLSPTSVVLARCAAVTRTFGKGQGAVVAVHDVSCEVRAGDRIAVTGPSGSGKSTLLHILAGLDQPTAGSVSWPAIGPIRSLRPGSVGIVFQGPSLLPPLNVLENVALPLLLLGSTEAEATDWAMVFLTYLGLEGLVQQLPEELSGGQSQRVAIARALVTRPRLVLADEPTGQLDHVSASAVIDVLLNATSDAGTALVVTTHDHRIADKLTHQWAMADGHITSRSDLTCSA